MRKRSAPTPPAIREATLLIGLLSHGAEQSDILVMRNIFKDGLERAYKMYSFVRSALPPAQRRRWPAPSTKDPKHA